MCGQEIFTFVEKKTIKCQTCYEFQQLFLSESIVVFSQLVPGVFPRRGWSPVRAAEMPACPCIASKTCSPDGWRGAAAAQGLRWGSGSQVRFGAQVWVWGSGMGWSSGVVHTGRALLWFPTPVPALLCWVCPRPLSPLELGMCWEQGSPPSCLSVLHTLPSVCLSCTSSPQAVGLLWGAHTARADPLPPREGSHSSSRPGEAPGTGNSPLRGAPALRGGIELGWSCGKAQSLRRQN